MNFFLSVKAASGAQFPFFSPFGPWPKKWENCSACLKVKEKKSKFEIKRKKHLCEVRDYFILRKYMNPSVALH